jgi:YgiT-type zinc finger domain-containing protein
MTDECNVCHGKIKFTLTNYTQPYKDQIVIVENVPAWVCEQCGETYFDPEVVERIQDLIWSGAAPTRTVTTPVYDLSIAS